MTKKHFEKIANIILGFKGKMSEEYREQFAEQFMDMFSEVNDRFDKNKFMKACGLNTPEKPEIGIFPIPKESK